MYRYHTKNTRETGFAMFSICPKRYRFIRRNKEETPFFPGGFLIKCLPDAVFVWRAIPFDPDTCRKTRAMWKRDCVRGKQKKYKVAVLFVCWGPDGGLLFKRMPLSVRTSSLVWWKLYDDKRLPILQLRPYFSYTFENMKARVTQTVTNK